MYRSREDRRMEKKIPPIRFLLSDTVTVLHTFVSMRLGRTIRFRPTTTLTLGFPFGYPSTHTCTLLLTLLLSVKSTSIISPRGGQIASGWVKSVI